MTRRREEEDKGFEGSKVRQYSGDREHRRITGIAQYPTSTNGIKYTPFHGTFLTLGSKAVKAVRSSDESLGLVVGAFVCEIVTDWNVTRREQKDASGRVR